MVQAVRESLNLLVEKVVALCMLTLWAIVRRVLPDVRRVPVEPADPPQHAVP